MRNAQNKASDQNLIGMFGVYANLFLIQKLFDLLKLSSDGYFFEKKSYRFWREF